VVGALYKNYNLHQITSLLHSQYTQTWLTLKNNLALRAENKPASKAFNMFLQNIKPTELVISGLEDNMV